ncbi:MAG: hypothetical protein ACPGPS_17300 [Rubripirellula sp.]
MIHYICDRCKRQINTDSQTRFIVQIDIQTASSDLEPEFEDDVDHLNELHQILEGMNEPVVESDEAAETSHHGRYDLCPECHRQFLKNPLGRDAVLALGFSNN